MNPSQMTTTEFANKIRSKYPTGKASDGRAYSDIPDAELAQKIVEKYPVYKTQISDFGQSSTTPDTGSFYGGGPNSIGAKLIKDVQEGADAYSQDKMSASQLLGPTKAVFRGVGDVAGAVFHPVGEALDKVTGGKLSEAFNKIAETSQAKGSLLDKLTDNPIIQKIAMENPQLGEDFQRALNIIFLGIENISSPEASTALSRTKAQVKTTPQVASDTINIMKDKASDITTSVKNKISDTKEAISTKIGGKTPNQILATPEDQVYKLSQPEREYYMKSQKESIAKKHADIETQVKKELDTKAQASKQQIEELNKEVDKAAYNKTIELKPKAVKLFGEQSQTYRNLVDEEISQHVNTEISQSELKQFIESKYADNPEVGKAMVNKLGITDTATPGFPDRPTSIGDIYEKTKSLRQDIGSGAKKGNRVYTSEEKFTDDAISTLSDFMKSKGVDLSKANNFWREWAPLRDKIITKLKPFDSGEFETKTFSKILKDSAKGDIHNENFVKAIEEKLGEPITKETKDAFNKLTSVEKQQLAEKTDAEIKLEENKLLKEKEMGKLDDKQFEIERLARRRKAIIKSLRWAGILIGYGQVKKYIPMLP